MFFGMRGLYWMTCLRVLDKLLECHPMSKDKEVKGGYFSFILSKDSSS